MTPKNQSNPKSKKLQQRKINLNSHKRKQTTTAEAPVYFTAKKNQGEELYCDQASLLSCSNCIKLNQKMYGLKPHYLLNNR